MAQLSLNSPQAGRLVIGLVALIIILKLFLLPSSGSSTGSHTSASRGHRSNRHSWRPSFHLNLKLPSWAKSDTSTIDRLGFLPLSPEVEGMCASYRWPTYSDRYHRRKIYDFNVIRDMSELETLGLRMAEMGDSVDYFVVVERVITSGLEEEASEVGEDGVVGVRYVRENMGMFERSLREKMIVATLNESTVAHALERTKGIATGLEGEAAREAVERDSALEQVLPMLEDEMIPTHGDILLSGDVDEIVRPEVLTAMRNCDVPRHVRLWTRNYYYSFQWLVGGVGDGLDGGTYKSKHRMGSVEGAYEQQHHLDATIFTGFKDTTRPSALRDSVKPDSNVHTAGWRCRFCFSSIQDIISNIASGSGSLAEDLMGVGATIDPAEILKRVRKGMDITGRQRELFRIDNNKDVPGAVVRDGAKYGYMLDRDPVDGNFVDTWELVELTQQGH